MVSEIEMSLTLRCLYKKQLKEYQINDKKLLIKMILECSKYYGFNFSEENIDNIVTEFRFYYKKRSFKG